MRREEGLTTNLVPNQVNVSKTVSGTSGHTQFSSSVPPCPHEFLSKPLKTAPSAATYLHYVSQIKTC